MTDISLLEPFRALFYAPFYVAEARGGFAREGLHVRLETAGTPTAAAERLLAGDADLAWSGPMRPMMLRAHDPACPLRSFGAAVMRDPFLLVSGRQRPGFALSELARLRHGVVKEVPTPLWCLDDDLRRTGLDPATLDRVTDRTMPENAAAAAAGTLPVAQVFEPFACQVEDAGGAVLHAQATRGLTAYSAFYATEAKLASRREPFRAILRGLAEALAWITTASAHAIADTIAPRFPELPAAHRLRAVARYQALGIWSPDPRIPREAFDRLGQAMVSAGVIPAVPSYEACVDAAIVEEALA